MRLRVKRCLLCSAELPCGRTTVTLSAPAACRTEGPHVVLVLEDLVVEAPEDRLQALCCRLRHWLRLRPLFTLALQPLERPSV
eukprot:4078458-Alexandrium_andersonii.AAC.1